MAKQSQHMSLKEDYCADGNYTYRMANIINTVMAARMFARTTQQLLLLHTKKSAAPYVDTYVCTHTGINICVSGFCDKRVCSTFPFNILNIRPRMRNMRITF